MNFYQRGKIEVKLNGDSVGFVDAVGIERKGGTIVNLSIEGDTPRDREAGIVTKVENYDDFFKKLNKAFSKE